MIPHHIRLAYRKSLPRDTTRPGSIAAMVAATVKAKRDALLAPPPGYCLTCASRWGRHLYQGKCVCTGSVLLGKASIPRSPQP